MKHNARQIRAALATVVACISLGHSASRAQECGQGSATLRIVGGSPPARGGVLELELSGAPGAPLVIAADTGPGPRVLPRVGTLCLDRSPRLTVLADGIRGGLPVIPQSGTFPLSVELSGNAEFVGRTFYLQGVVKDPSAPNGYAISNGVAVTLLPSIFEDFSTEARKDGASTTADWRGDGLLRGRLSSPRTSTIEPADTGFRLAVPLSPSGSHFQMLFSASDVGARTGESVVGMSWGPRSAAVFASTYRRMEVLVGHSSLDDLGLNFAENFSDTPLSEFSGDYSVPRARDTAYFPWPEFSTDFDYNGTDNLLFEARVPPGAATFQLFRNSSTATTPVRRAFGPSGSPLAGGGDFTTYHTRLTLVLTRTVAESLFYDTGSENPDFGPPHLRMDSLPPGTAASVEVEGADDVTGDGVADPGTYTGFRADADRVDGKRFIRFRVLLKANAKTGGIPAVTSIAIPYAAR